MRKVINYVFCAVNIHITRTNTGTGKTPCLGQIFAGCGLESVIAPALVVYRDRFAAAGKTPSEFRAFLTKYPNVLGVNPLELPVKLDFVEQELGIDFADVQSVCWRAPKSIYVRAKIFM